MAKRKGKSESQSRSPSNEPLQQIYKRAFEMIRARASLLNPEIPGTSAASIRQALSGNKDRLKAVIEDLQVVVRTDEIEANREVACLAVHRSSRTIAVCRRNQLSVGHIQDLHSLDWVTGRSIKPTDFRRKIGRQQERPTAPQAVRAMSWDGHGQKLAVAFADGSTHVYDFTWTASSEDMPGTAMSDPIAPCQHSGWANALAWSGDSQTLAVGGHSGVFLVSWREGACPTVRSLPGVSEVNCLAFDENYILLVGSYRQDISISEWAIVNQPVYVDRYARVEQHPFSLDLSPCGTYVAAGGLRDSVLLWSRLDRRIRPVELVTEGLRVAVKWRPGETDAAANGQVAFRNQAGDLYLADALGVFAGRGNTKSQRICLHVNQASHQTAASQEKTLVACLNTHSRLPPDALALSEENWSTMDWVDAKTLAVVGSENLFLVHFADCSSMEITTVDSFVLPQPEDMATA